MIRRMLARLLADAAPDPSIAARVLARRAARIAATERREAIAAHIANFGPFARGLDTLKGHPAND